MSSSSFSEGRCVGEDAFGGDHTASLVHTRDILLNITSNLDLRGVNTMLVVCRQWHQVVRQEESIWKGLLLQRYPNLQKAIPAETLKKILNGGRNDFLQALAHHTDKMRPVRLSSLPVESQLQTPGEELLERWQPESVIFLIDIWKGPVRILSEATTVRLDDCDDEAIRASYLEVQLEDPVAIQAMEELHRETLSGIGKEYDDEDDHTVADTQVWADVNVVPLFAKVSYLVQGKNVPACNPITLLSEPGPFHISSPHGMHYQTDVEKEWMEEPGANPDTFRQQDARYGAVPFPINPGMDLIISPIGSDEYDNGFEVTSMYPGSDIGKCSIYLDVAAQFKGSFFGVDFSEQVLPVLLSLWKDAAWEWAIVSD